MKSIVRDCLAGKEYVEIKNKTDLPIKGYASVYLYNASTGRLELEAHTPNIIYPEVYAWLRSYQWDLFCAGAYNKTNSYSGYFEMDQIFLTTSTAPEEEYVTLLNVSFLENGTPGKTIGWANKSTYSGSDTQRGTPNAAESYADNNKVHWVFDWPTHAGNGTFQTIIWANTLSCAIQYKDYTLGILSSYSSGFGLASDGTYLYALNSSGVLYKLNTSGSVVDQFNTSVPGYYYFRFGMTFDGTYLWVMDKDGVLYKLTTNGTLISSVSTGLPASATYKDTGWGIAFKNGYIFALRDNGYLYKISTNGEIIGTPANTGVSGAYSAGFGLATDGEYFYAINADGTLWKFREDGTNVYQVSRNIIPGVNVGVGYSIAFLNGKFYALGMKESTSSYLVEFFGSARYLARTRLATPITKTNQQTMKIQYDFIYEE